MRGREREEEEGERQESRWRGKRGSREKKEGEFSSERKD